MTWTVDSNTLTWLVIIAASVGFFVGLAISLFRRPKLQVEPPNEDLIHLAYLWRNKADGTLWLQVNEKSGMALEAFEGADREKARSIAAELGMWVGQPAGSTSSSRLKALAQSQNEVHVPGVQPTDKQTQPSSLNSDTAFHHPAGIEQSTEPSMANENSERPRIDIVKGIRLAIEGSPAKKESSIAAQVDEILQERLKGTELEQRGIRLMELPGRGMVVMIGLDQYDAVDDVPFPDIKAMLKSAVAEWERKMLG